MSEVLNWGMTPGMGDVMMAMNCAHRWSYVTNTPLVLNLHWFHGKDHLHHPEDPETIIERADYILGLYLKSNVEVNHILNSNRTDLQNREKRYDWFQPRMHKKTNFWRFDPSVELPVDKNKVVIWRPTFNAEEPRYWKRIIPNNDWDLLINHYREIGYDVVELCYRTPIREATYHINTCDFIICYDGMWHYIAKNFLKPMIVASFDQITRYHTRHALPLAINKFMDWTYNIHTPVYYKETDDIISPYDLIHRKSENHKQHFWDRYYALGPGGNRNKRGM